ncbi:MAG TPA: serine/threonine-protein kinase [Roseimicrobium sp.]|nr:serine/threonine-protein kinase [Roseimicrobium sp.]
MVTELASGQKVGGGRYTLVRFLGKGGMGMVWLARDEHLEDDVALKFLAPEIVHDADALGDMRRETLKTRKLSHPNIIRIHDFHQGADEAPFISMEFIEGAPLGDLKAEQPERFFVWEQLSPLVMQMCAALDYAHSQKVIHRDLKPGNMMVTVDGVLKLADFGLAASASESISRVSRQMGSSGTPVYMSPQQMSSAVPRPADDIYSLGATLYELLTSKPPFHTGDIFRQVMEIAPVPMGERLRDLELQNEIPPDVSAMVMACLSKQPEQRPQSAAAVAEWVGLAGARSRVAPPVEPVAVEQAVFEDLTAAEGIESIHSEIGKSRKSLWVGLGLAAVVVLGIGGVMMMGKPVPKTGAGGSSKEPAAPPAIQSQTPGPTPPSSSPAAVRPVPGPIISLLPLVDIKKHVVSGSWSIEGDGIKVAPGGTFAVCEFPYEPPEEYDFQADFTPTAAGNNVNFHLIAGGSSFVWKINAHGRTPPIHGLDLVDGKKMTMRSDAVASSPPELQVGRRYSTKIEIRRSGLRAYIDSVLVLEWVGDYKRLSSETGAALHNPRAIGIGSYKRAVVFHRVAVLPLNSPAGADTKKAAGL